jgi:purine nucleosidase
MALIPDRSWTRCASLALLAVLASIAGAGAPAQSGVSKQMPRGEKIIIDTDIGTDIDDAFAVALALQSPEFRILGITTASGDTNMRARLVTRLLKETGRDDIPVAAGIPTGVGTAPGPAAADNVRGQFRYGLRTPAQAYPDAVNFILEQIRRSPGEITLITIGPLTNIGAAIDRDAVTFRKVGRVVAMAGSVYLGYDQIGYVKHPQPSAEYNIASDTAAAQKLFSAGVPLYVVPLDSTQIKLEELNRARILTHATPLTDALALLYLQWSGGSDATPTLYDAMAVAYALAPQLCPMSALRLRVDDKGFTRVDQGPPNVRVCLHSDWQKFFAFYMPRLTGPPPKP